MRISLYNQKVMKRKSHVSCAKISVTLARTEELKNWYFPLHQKLLIQIEEQQHPCTIKVLINFKISSSEYYWARGSQMKILYKF